MREFLTSFLALLTWTALVTVPAHAQIKRDKKATGDLTTPVKGRTAAGSDALPSKSREKEALAKLGIKRFDAGRDGPKINVIGVIYNVWPQTVPFSYQISKWTGADWTVISSGGSQVSAKGTFSVKANLPSTKNSLRLKLEVNGGAKNTASKEFQLGAKKPAFVVHYKTKNGGWACVFDETADSGADASSREQAQQRALACQKLGFETQIPVTKKPSLDPSKKTTYRVRVYARAQRELDATFDTEPEASDFRRRIMRQDWVSQGALFDVRIDEQ